MYAALTTVLMASSALAAPAVSDIAPRVDSACVDRTQDLKTWTVKSFDYHSSETFTTPAHQNSWGYVNFTLENPALGYTAVCSASSNQLSQFFYGNQDFKCQIPAIASAAGDAAKFTYSTADSNLRVEQNWNCGEDSGRFTAKGGIKLNLDCKEDKYQNPDWKQGQIYSSRTVTCGIIDAETPIEELNGVARH